MFAWPQSLSWWVSFQLCPSSADVLAAAAWGTRVYQQHSLSGAVCWCCWLDELVDRLNTSGAAAWKAALKKWVGPRHLPACFCVVLSSLVSVLWTRFASCSSACLADASQLVVVGIRKWIETSVRQTKPAVFCPDLKPCRRHETSSHDPVTSLSVWKKTTRRRVMVAPQGTAHWMLCS